MAEYSGKDRIMSGGPIIFGWPLSQTGIKTATQVNFMSEVEGI